jgi:hemerythrin-like domain-containing protein
VELLERLGAEHARIATVLDAFDVFAREIETTGTVDALEAIRFVTFFRGFSDGLHHDREEHVLFPGLERAGFSPDFGPLAHLREQHRKQARLLLALEKGIAQRPPWGPSERSAIVAAARAFTAFERDHMAQECDLLLPAAAKDLEAQAAELDAEEARFDRLRAPRWDPKWLEALAGELAAAHAGSK